MPAIRARNCQKEESAFVWLFFSCVIINFFWQTHLWVWSGM